MKKMARIQFLLCALLLFIGMYVTSCSQYIDKTPAKSVEGTKGSAEFENFTDSLFKEMVQEDSISLNYMLAEPEKYNIDNHTVTLGEYSLTDMQKNLAKNENYRASLREFSYDTLTEEQKLIYDILTAALNNDDQIEDLLLYQEVLSPTIGVQAQLPILLAEYNFYTKEDISTYISLLALIPDYFDDLIKFQKEKAAAGLFMSDFAVEDVTKQCQEFIGGKETNFLITVFNDRINSYKDLTDEERTDYKKQNKEAILNYVIPAYETLIKDLNSLKGQGKNNAGLCNFEKGKQYYEYLAGPAIGSSKTVEEQKKMLEKELNTCIKIIQKEMIKDPSLLNTISDIKYPMSDPKEILAYLEKNITKQFPSVQKVNYTVKYVHKSLEDDLSPAFYLTPPIDNWQNNSIYINAGEQFDMSAIFPTLAHEGYPGHLYQCVYFNQQNPDPIRNILHFGSYSEGWATYAEMSSFSLSGLKDNEAAVMRANQLASLVISARLDIGIHYDGWDKKEVSKYLKKTLGLADEEMVDTVFQSIVEEPGNFLQYAIGYLEFQELRNTAEEELGSNFDESKFHEFLLKIGPAPFSVIQKWMDVWCASNK